jgi:hypothetical protein
MRIKFCHNLIDSPVCEEQNPPLLWSWITRGDEIARMRKSLLNLKLPCFQHHLHPRFFVLLFQSVNVFFAIFLMGGDLLSSIFSHLLGCKFWIISSICPLYVILPGIAFLYIFSSYLKRFVKSFIEESDPGNLMNFVSIHYFLSSDFSKNHFTFLFSTS